MPQSLFAHRSPQTALNLFGFLRWQGQTPKPAIHCFEWSHLSILEAPRCTREPCPLQPFNICPCGFYYAHSRLSFPAASTALYQHPATQNSLYFFMYLQLKTCKTNPIKEVRLLTGDYHCLDHLLTLCQGQVSCLIMTLEPIQGEAKYETEIHLLCQSEVRGWANTRYKHIKGQEHSSGDPKATSIFTLLYIRQII